MDNFKLKYEMLDGGVKVTEWMIERTARQMFNQLKENAKCVWCELLYSPVCEDCCFGEDYFDEEQIVDEFVNKVVVLMGKRLVIKTT